MKTVALIFSLPLAATLAMSGEKVVFEGHFEMQGYHGPPDANHWVRFDDFRILKLED